MNPLDQALYSSRHGFRTPQHQDGIEAELRGALLPALARFR
jgi:hypothetical protein